MHPNPALNNGVMLNRLDESSRFVIVLLIILSAEGPFETALLTHDVRLGNTNM
jgi:hypothetical protein